ncbi:MAG: hypothetical protein SPL13_02530 [Clostridia bacterium]|nr:hypothetical protein [Clostridia bacterium]
MKNVLNDKKIKNYEKPSAEMFYFANKPLNVLFVSQGDGQGTVDGGGWGDMNDNNNG